MPENILGMDILQGQTLQIFVNEVGLLVRELKPELRGNASREPVNLPPTPSEGR